MRYGCGRFACVVRYATVGVINKMGPITFRNIQVCYGKQEALSVQELDIPVGKVTAIVGPNGGGKTTLAKVLCGEIAFSGSVNVDPESISYLHQSAGERNDFPVTVLEYVSLGLFPALGVKKSFAGEPLNRIKKMLEVVYLSAHQNKLLSQLSGGEWQRVQLARQLLLDKPIIVLDEPFSAMDCKVSSMLQERLRDVASDGKTVVVITHDLASVKKFFDWTVVLSQKVKAVGNPQEVLTGELLEMVYGLEVLS